MFVDYQPKQLMDVNYEYSIFDGRLHHHSTYEVSGTLCSIVRCSD